MGVRTVLCVAEKPSIAKAIANHLGDQVTTHNIQGTTYVKNYEFNYTFPQWGRCSVTVTSVLGHLLSHEFEPRYKSWTSCDPSALFNAHIEVFINSKNKPIADNIKRHARRADVLYIWTDCDREGEHIGTEIRSVAAQSNQALGRAGGTVRAHFSHIERAHIIHAAHHPADLNEAQANAIASRIELDLRVGASFTRHLTLSLRPVLQLGNRLEASQFISYGSCQFPTLGFIVERYWRAQNFIPEPFWSIKLMHQEAGIRVNFSWARKHLFDRMTAVILYERCLTSRNAQVQKVKTTLTSKWKPLPLTTLELQKCGSKFFGIDSQKVLQLAEKLYQKGWISYPRTETDQFDQGMDLRGLIQKQAQGGPWADYATALVEGGFSWPRNGRNNDKAHPPIHPVNFVNPTMLSYEEQRVYEFVVRRFLACCSKDAQGSKTDLSILYGLETFNTSGLIILERNYLDVYIYDRWSNQELPPFIEGEVFEPTEALLCEGKTSPPEYLTEPDLLAIMNENGIGTDATMADHIVTITDRQYVQARAQPRQAWHGNDEESEELPAQARAGNSHRGRNAGARRRGGRNSGASGGGAITGVREFIPTTLGAALVEGHENMGFETNLTKPFLRKEMELKMNAICNGQTTKARVVNETIEQYRGVYARMKQHPDALRTAVRKYVFGEVN
ncbi:DNA topoisomerase III [Lindgomyces ingoldianus]|uniref:DNA topoisomerase III n=1 Tax=Lindgomyces ingoldianus TaxID=673940 RepID=A0ACB6QSA3_9PLEO|nr:DNA topoisomerase III [Lindgomyces ingoldianus]KAF2469712.1 DNA topoisomerase III [Lindgomyces ingoldianus]